MHRTLIAAVAGISLVSAPPRTALSQQQGVSQAGSTSESAMSMLPMSSASAEAKRHATLGQRALDMGHRADAIQHFNEAVAADPKSVTALIGAANASLSFVDFDTKLEAAAKIASRGSRAEQLEVGIAQKQLASDFVGAELVARELVAAEPKNARSYLALAAVQQNMGREVEARRTLEKAIAVAPDFSPARMQLAFSYMTSQPSDPARAREHVERLVALEPAEAQAFITQGSYYRATNQLLLAKATYSRAAALDPKMALPLQQRGHVESFLGNYDAARADYDAAARVGKPNERAGYLVYRALVAAHAGQPAQSIAELGRLVSGIDAMRLPDPVGSKLAALTPQLLIAIHSGDFASAERAMKQRAPLVREQVSTASDQAVRRLAEADIAYYEGLLAARKGDAAAAKAKASDIMRIVAEASDPQKNQPAHAVLGVAALQQKDYAGAAAHLAQVNPNDMYMQYQRALALDALGRGAEAKELFGKISRFNFNSVDVALVRADATKRAK